jgi:DNA-3-methyladenine glycosylase II
MSEDNTQEQGSVMNFKYGKKEMEYLKSRDRRLGEVIDRIGRIRWTVEPDLFSAIVQNIVSQQISGSAAAWRASTSGWSPEAQSPN